MDPHVATCLADRPPSRTRQPRDRDLATPATLSSRKSKLIVPHVFDGLPALDGLALTCSGRIATMRVHERLGNIRRANGVVGNAAGAELHRSPRGQRAPTAPMATAGNGSDRGVDGG